MPVAPDALASRLTALARQASAHAAVPYSGAPDAVVLLLADGTWIPGVRVESASFGLTIAAVVNAFSTAVACERTDVVAVAVSGAVWPETAAYLAESPAGRFVETTPGLFVHESQPVLAEPGARLDPFLRVPRPERPPQGIELARRVAQRAYVPESRFRVGCVFETAEGTLIPGVNVEHRDWARILCAERNALGTAISYGVTALRSLYLSCPTDPAGTPCGACRQLLAEHGRHLTIWMDRGTEAPEMTTPPVLLPASFVGAHLDRIP